MDDKKHPSLDDYGIIHYWMYKNIHSWMIIDDISLSIETNRQLSSKYWWFLNWVQESSKYGRFCTDHFHPFLDQEHTSTGSRPGDGARSIYCIAGKFGGELILAVWRIDQSTTKLKSANIKSFLYLAHAKAIAKITWWVWFWAPAITRKQHISR
jgi:hypothetical protein